MRAIYILLALAFALRAVADYGMEEWVYITDFSYDGFGLAVDVEVDNEGYIYATGYYGPDIYHLDYFTTKVDNDGNEIWLVTYNGPADGIDCGNGLEVDSDGSVYVTGGSAGVGTYYDVCTIKYDPDGNEEWVRRYDGPPHDDDQGRFITLTNAGDVVVAGATVSSGADRDFFVGKYDADGNEIWTAVYDGPVGGEDYIFDNGPVTDEYGNIYVTGASDGRIARSGVGHDYCTIKYDSDGKEVWTARYNGPGDGFDRPSAGLALDSEGNVFVSGESRWVQLNYATVKYDNDGKELWAVNYDGPALTDIPYDITVDKNGNAYVTGIQYLVGFDFESCTIKYDGDGNQIWAKKGDLDGAREIALDEYGGAYCCGDLSPPDDAAVVKYDGKTGDTQWVAKYDGPESGWDYLWSITIDNQGAIFVCGTCNADDQRLPYGIPSNGSGRDIYLPGLYSDRSGKPNAYSYGRGLLAGAPFVMKYSNNVSVELLRFAAVPRDKRIALEWEVSETEDVDGFNLYRREVNGSGSNRVVKVDGPAKAETDDWTKINGALITGANPYSYLDEGVETGVTYEYELEAVIESTAKTLGTTTATAGAGLLSSYALYQSRPNPASGTATIAFDLPETTPVTLTVYDISGRKVTTLVDETLAAGEHAADVSGLSPGVYVYKLDAGNYSASKKMVVVR